MKIKRLNLNVDSYVGEKSDIKAVLSSCLKLAKKHGWEIEKIVASKGLEILALKRIVPNTAKSTTEVKTPKVKKLKNSKKVAKIKNIYISAGIHGDEPAGPLAIQKLLVNNNWPENLNIYLLPCLNPTGCKLHTRENKDGADLNREYLKPKSAEVVAHIAWLEKQVNFDMSICLHEDWEADGFYIYGSNKIMAKKIAKEVENVFPLEQNLADDRPVKNGVVVTGSYKSFKMPFWPEAFYLHIKKKASNFTLEASSDYNLEDRVLAHVTAVVCALQLVSSVA